MNWHNRTVLRSTYNHYGDRSYQRYKATSGFLSRSNKQATKTINNHSSNAYLDGQ
ncbi:hypothetical protein KBB05_03390 [Patescibacteria group bacterium]|nr:hypothetical protein [Patescibacteria group bacterium]